MKSTLPITRLLRHGQWLLLLVLLSTGVLLLIPAYWTRMWGAGHYQYFPLVFLAFGVFLWSIRGRIAESTESPHTLVATSLLVGLSILLCLANLLYSNFLCIVAVVTAIAAAIYLKSGWSGLKISLPVLSLLIFAIPLPMHLDELVIIRMQFLASDCASRLLDLTGVIHFRQGVLLQTFEKQFLTEEACSGIRSLFSSWTLVAVYGVGMGHRWWRILFNLMQTVPWVLIGNVLRIAAVVAFADVSPWIASGLGHEILGLLVSSFILLMVCLVDFVVASWRRTEWGVANETDEPVLPMIFASWDDLKIAGRSSFLGKDQPIARQIPLSPLSVQQQKVAVVCLILVSIVSIRLVSRICGFDLAQEAFRAGDTGRFRLRYTI